MDKLGHIDRHLNDLPERTKLQMAFCVTQYTNFTKAFFTFKMSYGLTVN